MSSPDLPPEIIQLVIQHLPRHQILPLLTLNRHWHRVIVAELYHVIRIRNIRDQYHYRNLFCETRRSRQGKQQRGNSFYSTMNYAAHVRQLDLSWPYPGKKITDALLDDLTKDCIQLESINIYNCHEITSRGLARVLENCRIRHLYASMATSITSKCFLIPPLTHLERLETINLHGLSATHFFRSIIKRDKNAIKHLDHIRTIHLTGPIPNTLIPIIGPTLRDLTLKHVKNEEQEEEGNRSLQLLFEYAPLLTRIRLKGYHLTSSSLEHLPLHLQALELDHCRLSHDTPLPPPFLKYLKTLELHNTSLKSSETWIQQCTERLLRFTAPPEMTALGLNKLMERCPHLAHLTLHVSTDEDNSITSDLLDRALAIPCWGNTLVSLDVNIPFHVLDHPLYRLEHLHMRFPVPKSWLEGTALQDLYPSIHVLYLSQLTLENQEQPIWMGDAPWLDQLDAFMLSTQYYREPTEQLVSLREHYEYWHFHKDIW
ncbi:hypothetical protein K492DRAFT_209757 [Lichtheimia hyalospora FSU 10163]|nr:hypothetical protein K492DRAFT_209757 [Lichtheimia hyalospora FSU 10163]